MPELKPFFTLFLIIRNLIIKCVTMFDRNFDCYLLFLGFLLPISPKVRLDSLGRLVFYCLTSVDFSLGLLCNV